MFYTGLGRFKAFKPICYDGSAAGVNLKPPTAYWNATMQAPTLVDGAISSQPDVTGNGNTATQGTAANRPLLSRADNAENRVFYSQSYGSGSAWTSNLVTATNDVVASPTTGLITAGSIVPTAVSSGSHYQAASITYAAIGQSVKTIIRIKANNWQWVSIRFIGTAFAGLPNQFFDIANGVAGSIGGAVTSSFINPLGNGWYDVSITATATASGSFSVLMYLASANGTNTSTGDGVSGVYATEWQVGLASTSDTYVATTTFPQYAGINGNRVPVFDGSNDSLTTSLAVNPTGGMWGVVVVKKASSTVYMAPMSARVSGATDRLQFVLDTNGSIVLQVRNGVSDYIGRTAPASTITDAVTVVSWTYDGGTASSGIKIYKNGVQVDTGNSAAGVYAVPTAGATLSLGNLFSNFSNGYLLPAAFGQGSVISDAERIAWEKHLMDRFGV